MAMMETAWPMRPQVAYHWSTHNSDIAMPTLLISSCATSDFFDQLSCHSWLVEQFFCHLFSYDQLFCHHSSGQLIYQSYYLTTSGCAPPQPTQLGGGGPWTGRWQVAKKKDENLRNISSKNGHFHPGKKSSEGEDATKNGRPQGGFYPFRYLSKN